ncbi:hypothetical protein L195_g054053 [Trifolium pratense]|uniref:RNase H type-1 domain-containing protein n=1 Tax=Trifolium pratense TaxID=57577 RepID=A0A2K3KDY9_TRIPR|nr:hypothetical protein L195_g054053 [Trifolium pratense]
MLQPRWSVAKRVYTRIEDCNALHTEMWEMYTRMEMARRLWYKHLIVESDSNLLIDMATKMCKLNGNTPTLANRIQDISNL